MWQGHNMRDGTYFIHLLDKLSQDAPQFSRNGKLTVTTRNTFINSSAPHIIGGQQALEGVVLSASAQHFSPGRTAVAGTTAAADPRYESSDALIKAVVICDDTFPHADLTWEVCA